jgi:uncharacterized membrane protein
MSSTFFAVYDTLDQAQETIYDLVDAGFKREDVGLAVIDDDGILHNEVEDAVTGTDGAVFGAVWGMLIGMATIPLGGVGVLAAAGGLAGLLSAGIGTATGALTGGLVGSLVKTGVPHQDAEFFIESMRRGGALVSVTAFDFDAERAKTILLNHAPVDMDTRLGEWRVNSDGEKVPDVPETESLAALDDGTFDDTEINENLRQQ